MVFFHCADPRPIRRHNATTKVDGLCHLFRIAMYRAPRAARKLAVPHDGEREACEPQTREVRLSQPPELVGLACARLVHGRVTLTAALRLIAPLQLAQKTRT